MKLKQYLLILLASFISFVLFNEESLARFSGIVSVHNHSSASAGGGTLNLSGTLGSTKACASGYQRITPNYCWHKTGGVLVFNSNGTASCSTTTALTGVTDAKGVQIRASHSIASLNAVGLRSQVFSYFDINNDNTCTANGGTGTTDSGIAFEFNATAAGTTIGQVQTIAEVPSNTSGQIKFSETGNGLFQNLQVLGYYD